MAYNYSGKLLTENRNASEARSVLKTAFMNNRKRFMDRFADTRASELLTRQFGKPGYNGSGAVSHIILWNVSEYATTLGNLPDIDSRSNIVSPVDLRYSANTTPPVAATIGASLAALPAGRRFLRMPNGSSTTFGFHCMPTNGSGSWKNGLFDRHSVASSTGDGVMMEAFKEAHQEPDSVQKTFFAALRAYGASQLGADAAEEILDGYYTDVELHKNCFSLSTATGDKWLQLFADEGWEDFRTLIFKPTWDQDFWDAIAILKSTSGPYTDERCFVVDAFLAMYYHEALDIMLRMAGDSFDLDRLSVHDYGTAGLCPTQYPVFLNAYAGFYNLGLGGRSLLSSGQYYYGGQAATPSWYNWNTRAVESMLVGDSDALKQHGVLTQELNHLHSQIAGSDATTPKYAWLTYETQWQVERSITPFLGTDGYYAELVLHVALLMGSNDNREHGGLHFYNSSCPDDDFQKLVDLVNERDAACGVVGGKPISRPPETTFYNGHLVSSFLCGGRIVHRVTPNQGASNQTITGLNGDRDALFQNSLGSVVFHNCQVVAYLTDPDLAPFGYWVFEYPVEDDANLIGPDSGQLLPIGAR